MASKTQIAKKALNHLGDRFDISDITESSTEAEQCNLVFDEAVKEVLREHAWKFAKSYICPASLVGTPPKGWGYMFTYPTNSVRVIKIVNPLGDRAPPIKFDVARNNSNVKVLLCNEETPEIEYTQLITDPNEYDDLFREALEYRVASKVCMALTGDASLMEAMYNLSRSRVAIAAQEDANEGVEETHPEAEWIEARA